MKISRYLLVVLFCIILISINGQQNVMTDVKNRYIVDSITISNAYLLSYNKEHVVAKIYEPNEDIETYYTQRNIIVSGTHLNEVINKKLKIDQVYPKYGFFTMSYNRKMIFLLESIEKLKSNHWSGSINIYFNEMFEDVTKEVDSTFNRSDSTDGSIFKFKERETVFYVLLMEKSLYYLLCEGLDSEYDDKTFEYVVFLIPKNMELFIR